MSVASAKTLTTTQRGLVQTAKVSFSGASTVSIDNCFSSLYTHYIVKRNLLGSVADSSIHVRLRAAGVDHSSTYRQQWMQADSTTVQAGRATTNTHFTAGLGLTQTTTVGYSDFWISNPFEAVRTTAWADLGYGTVSGTIIIQSHVNAHDQASSYDGLTIYPGSGTITGTISVYGLVKS